MMKKFIETANQSAEMCVIGLYGACEIVKTYPGVNPEGGSTSSKSLQDVKESIAQAMVEYNNFLFIVLSF